MSRAASACGICQKSSRSSLEAVRRWQGLRLASLHGQWSSINHGRALQSHYGPINEVPFRKQLKDEAKRRRKVECNKEEKDISCRSGKTEGAQRLSKWRLTVGLEIHAQLNTERKLFSTAKSSENDAPNTNISVFDLAFPGSQPELQKATLIPAIRAAFGLSCNIHEQSRFDRKHYYYHDQPAGYQITQYYRPFAVDGKVTLYDYDGIAPEDGRFVDVGIKQVQMEQDTAKTMLQPPSTAMIDFNRIGHPLIEIITHPQIHHVQTASACIRKIQAILQAVNAVTKGMELGGLRADVNVSVSPTNSESLGQRTEIKNLSSFKAVECAIIAERDRQIKVLESGASIVGETRGWTLGSSETKRLRGKEGEVDYRYMPDPDVLPLIIGQELTSHIAKSIPDLPDKILYDLITYSGLSAKDAKTLITLDDGERLDYFDEVKSLWSIKRAPKDSLVKVGNSRDSFQKDAVTQHNALEPRVAGSSPVFDKIVANWVLHELGALLSAAAVPFSPTLVPPISMVEILSNLSSNHITGTTAKRLLATVFDGDRRDIDIIIEDENLALQHLSQAEYLAMARDLMGQNPDKVKQIQEKGQMGKLKWFVGEMMRQGEGKVAAIKAEAALKELLRVP